MRPIAIAALSLSLALTARAPADTTSGVPVTPWEVNPLKVGMTIPDADLITASGERFDLSEAVAARRTIILFYRGNW